MAAPPLTPHWKDIHQDLQDIQGRQDVQDIQDVSDVETWQVPGAAVTTGPVAVVVRGAAGVVETVSENGIL